MSHHACVFFLPLCTVTDSAWPLDVPPPLLLTPAPGNARNPAALHPPSSRNRPLRVRAEQVQRAAVHGAQLVFLLARTAKHFTEPEHCCSHCSCSPIKNRRGGQEQDALCQNQHQDEALVSIYCLYLRAVVGKVLWDPLSCMGECWANFR